MTDDLSGRNQADNPDDAADKRLSSVLRQWKAPDVPVGLDARVLRSYRRKRGPEPLWRRFFTTSVRVPLPLAVAAMILLLVSLTLTLSRPAVEGKLPPQMAQAPADQPMVVKTSLAGFEPVEDVNVNVVTEHLQ